jgi:hypothetical protein
MASGHQRPGSHRIRFDGGLRRCDGRSDNAWRVDEHQHDLLESGICYDTGREQLDRLNQSPTLGRYRTRGHCRRRIDTTKRRHLAAVVEAARAARYRTLSAAKGNASEKFLREGFLWEQWRESSLRADHLARFGTHSSVRIRRLVMHRQHSACGR